MSIKLKAGIRNVAGKGAARSVRKEKKVPAVIYGDKKAPIAIELDTKEWVELIKKPGLRAKLFEIETPNGSENTMLKEIQYHPVTDLPMHVDFKRIDVSQPVNVVVRLELINKEKTPGLKMGGILNFAKRRVPIVAKVNDIPEKIQVDISRLNIGDVIHGRDLKLPSGVELGLRQEDLAFVIIAGKMAEEVEETPAAEEAAGETAPAKGAAKPADGDNKETPAEDKK